MLTNRKYLFGTTVLAGVLTLSAPAFAQSSSAAQDETRVGDIDVVEEIVVTGSRIRRDAINAPTPIIQVSREDLLTTGQTTVIDYLATIPALSNSVVPSDTTGGGVGDGGLSLANLRSLGSGRTLTLIDGHRQVGSNGGSLSVDVDTIPRLLIENIEIITGGASSVYGADAVSGVLNFVLRKDFEGLEVDANYGEINQGGNQHNTRVSALGGINLLDDKLNLWAFAEYDQSDKVRILDIDWYNRNPGLATVDADPTNPAIGPVSDDVMDIAGPFYDRRQLQILRWGQTTLANNQPASPLNDPDIPFGNCTSTLAANCFNVGPGSTWVFGGPGVARLADFGTRIGSTGLNRTINIGGDGDNGADFGQLDRTPESESYRYAAGLNFSPAENIHFSLDGKYIEESTQDVSQPTFYTFYINDTQPANSVDNALATNQFILRLADTAYLPANLRTAIQNNTRQAYTSPTNTVGGLPTGALIASPFAQHILFGPDRSQQNDRELYQVNASLSGELDELLFVKNFNWNLSYGFGQSKAQNVQRGVDNQRFQLASDAVVDVAGRVNGRPGEVVCRAQLLRAQNPANVLADSFRGGDLRNSAEGLRALNACTPLNVFGRGNQSEAALAYIDALTYYTEKNEQEQAVGFVSGELWDFTGAGRIGIALGVEHRREYTEALGTTASTGDRFLFNLGQSDFPGAEYTSDEAFAELSLPLFRDSWLGEYAELSGSYRYFDYSTVGTGDVYGVNFVYRPTSEITFKTSFNTSFRAPNLGENFQPPSPTFYNGVTDPCDTRVVTAITNTTDRANRVSNCTTLFAQVAARRGITNPNFDFNGVTTDPNDDYNPTYPSGVPGFAGGNPNLKPEESESFTFTTGFQPSAIPGFSVVLDYYEVTITDVIQSVTPAAASLNCVFGPSLNPSACDTIFRNNPVVAGTTAEARSQGFEIGDPVGLRSFLSSSINFAKLQTRGLDFTARYGFDTEEKFGLDFGRFDYSIRGNWLIEQKNFTNIANPSAFVENSSLVNFPRVRFTSQLTWAPTEKLSITWVADWQTAQNIVFARDQVNNLDGRPRNYYDTGNFTRNDFTVRYQVRDDLSLRAGVTNAFDAEQPAYFGTGFIDNFDPYGTRYFVGLNFRPF